jgi:hypothetical protein
MKLMFLWKNNLSLLTWNKIVVIASFLIIVLLSGCKNEKLEAKNDRDEKTHQIDVLYDEYLTGDIDHARQSVLKAIDILEKVTSFYEGGRAQGLCLGYSRLYCIEKYAGNDNSAYLAFIKAKYWLAMKQELDLYGHDSIKEKAKNVKEFTPELCEEYITKWDNAHTDGKGPVYIQKKQHLTTMPNLRR